MQNRQKLERENKNHTSHIALHTSQNGITLIALIITIIVMLILVGVTINVALNGGLFTKASQASKQMQVEADRETLLSAVVAAIGYDGKVDLADIELPTGWTGSNGTYTSPKGNTFTVTEDGKITGGSSSGGETNPVIADELKKYILGADGKGRNILEIVDGESMVFLQDPEDTNSTIHEKIKIAYLEVDEETGQQFINIRYNREVYKFRFEQIRDTSSEFYGQMRTVEGSLEKVSTPEGNLGKYVEYAGNTWIVLRDDASGVELITANTTEDEITLGGSDFDTAKESYNAAVTTLVEECKEATGIEIGGNVIGIRSVGGPAEDKTTSTIDFSKPFEEFQPNDSFLAAEFTGKNIKIEDDNYLEDYNQMKKIGILSADNMYDYWLASRFVDEYSGNVDFGVRCVDNGAVLGGYYLCSVYDNGDTGFNSPSCAVRPVVTLKSGILSGATEEGTIDNPIVLN